jgi:hypothetical protein
VTIHQNEATNEHLSQSACHLSCRPARIGVYTRKTTGPMCKNFACSPNQAFRKPLPVVDDSHSCLPPRLAWSDYASRSASDPQEPLGHPADQTLVRGEADRKTEPASEGPSAYFFIARLEIGAARFESDSDA